MRILAYRTAGGALATLATFDPALFTSGQPGFVTQDEESSGILDVTDVFTYGEDSTYLFDAQVHAPTVNNVVELVQRGQLMMMHIPNWDDVYKS